MSDKKRQIKTEEEEKMELEKKYKENNKTDQEWSDEK